MKLFALALVTDGKIELLEVNSDQKELQNRMKGLAIQHIYDNCGRNNYVDTLSSDVAIADCGVGLFAKFSGDNNNKITIYKKSEIKVRGWVYNVKELITTETQYYEVLEIAAPFLYSPTQQIVSQQAIQDLLALLNEEEVIKPARKIATVDIAQKTRANHDCLIKELNSLFEDQDL